MEGILGAVAIMFPLIFTNNLVMSLVKYVAQESMDRTWLRTVLVISSLVGVLAVSAITGQDVNFNELTDLGRLFLETLGVSVGAHLSYKAIKNA